MMKIIFGPARALVAAASLVASAAAGADVPDQRELALGMPDFKVIVPAGDWKANETKRRPDGSGAYYSMSSKQRDLVLSFFIEKSMPCKTAAACRDLALKNPAYKEAKDVKLSDQGRYGVAQFGLDRPMGFPVMQSHLLASAFVNGYEIDIHMSRTGDTRPDAAPFYDLLSALSYRNYVTYRVDDQALALPLGENWESTKPPADSSAKIAYQSTSPNKFMLLITPHTGSAGKKPGDEQLRALVEKAAAQVAPRSVEKTLPLVSIAGPEAKGYYYFATDPAPAPGEYRRMYQGTVALESMVVAFTILYNDGAETDAKSALASIRGMQQGATGK
jgi:hypothetical protein